MKIIIIGSGFGGLALAVRLQSQGFDVHVFEKNSLPGGHAYPLEKSGYHFDMGPTLITATEIIDRIFERAHESIHNSLNLTKLNPFYRIYFADGSHFDYSDDSESIKKQMAAFNRRDALRYDRYIEASHKIYDAVIGQGLGSTPFMDMRSMLKFAPRAIRLGAVLPSYTFVQRYFRDPRHRFIYSFHPLFIGGNPFRAPAVYQMIPYLEKNSGVWYSTGGMTTLVQKITTLFSKLGGTLHTASPVQQIVIKNQKAEGIISNDKFWPADIIVSNADFIHTYRDLVKPEHRKKWSNNKLMRLKYSMSAFMLFLGVKRQYPQLLHHTLILSKRYKGLIKDIFDNKILPDDFSMYLHVPTRTDAGMAPQGCESLYVLVPVANLNATINWEEHAQIFADKILAFLEHDFGLTDLKKSIHVMEIFTPLDFYKKQNAVFGSAWGVEPCLTQTGYFRPHNRSEDIAHLYIVGASTHPGAGLPGVMLSAETTEKVIVQDIEKGVYG